MEPCPAELPDLVFAVEGMMCQKNCATTVAEAIRTLPQVRHTIVTFATTEAQVWLQQDLPPSEVVDVIESVGYDAVLKEDHRHLSTTLQPATSSTGPSSHEYSYSDDAAGQSHSKADMVLVVEKMNNVRDLQAVEDTIMAVDGAVQVTIEASKQLVSVWGFADESSVIAALKQRGFPACNAASVPSPMHHASTATPATSSKTNTTSDKKKTKNRTNMLLDLSELSKKHNVHKIADSLRNVPGIAVDIDPIMGKFVISYNDMKMSQQQLIDILAEKQLGPYVLTEVSPNSSEHKGQRREFVYHIRGMSCGACAVKIEKALKTMPGVVETAVSVMTHQGRATIDDSFPNACGPRDLMEKVKSLGYECSLAATDGTHNDAQNGCNMELQQWSKLLVISLIFGIPVLMIHFGEHATNELMMFFMQPVMCGEGIELGQLLMLLFNTPILIGVGYKFYKSAILGAMNGMLGMDFLVMTGTAITFVYSLIQLGYACKTGISTEHIFFETTGMLLMFVTIGKYIEAYAKGKSASSIAELLKLQPSEALLVDSPSADRIRNPEETYPYVNDEDVRVMDVDLVQKGDIVKVMPGARIPTDGCIVLGTTHVDESMITGESNPVYKTKGDNVFGSTVNQDTCIYVSVTSYGAESALAQIVRLVESAQMNKAPVQDYADRIAGIFTPIILCIATLTFIVWLSLSLSKVVPTSWFEHEYKDPVLFSLLFAISVVVISCPCALGLATPTAIMVGTTVGAQNGILIKGGLAFEVAHKIDTIVFDKTGTLTMGKPSVTDVVPIESKSINPELDSTGASIIMIAATAEQNSEHPIALAVMKAAQGHRVAPLALKENAAISYVGSGVSCECSLGRILVGNRIFMKAQNVTVTAVADSAMYNLEIQGKTAICVALNEEIHGIIGVADVPKPEADHAIRALRSLGMDVWMMTGDNATTAEALANQLDLSQDRVMAGMFPQDKARKVRELQEAGHMVAMIGDGVNDSPALAQADLGVAIGAGTQIAMEAASMVLIRSDLHDLVVAFDLAKVVFNRIKLNFLWAVIYNIISIPFAAGVWYPWTRMALPPHYAGFAMALSSISVVISSLLLKRYQRPDDAQESKRKQLAILRQSSSMWKVPFERATVDYDTLPQESVHPDGDVEMSRM